MEKKKQQKQSYDSAEKKNKDLVKPPLSSSSNFCQLSLGIFLL